MMCYRNNNLKNYLVKTIVMNAYFIADLHYEEFFCHVYYRVIISAMSLISSKR